MSCRKWHEKRPVHPKTHIQKWKRVLSDVDVTHDGYIYFNEFENAIKKFIEPEIIIIMEESSNSIKTDSELNSDVSIVNEMLL